MKTPHYTHRKVSQSVGGNYSIGGGAEEVLLEKSGQDSFRIKLGLGSARQQSVRGNPGLFPR